MAPSRAAASSPRHRVQARRGAGEAPAVSLQPRRRALVEGDDRGALRRLHDPARGVEPREPEVLLQTGDEPGLGKGDGERRKGHEDNDPARALRLVSAYSAGPPCGPGWRRRAPALAVSLRGRGSRLRSTYPLTSCRCTLHFATTLRDNITTVFAAPVFPDVPSALRPETEGGTEMKSYLNTLAAATVALTAATPGFAQSSLRPELKVKLDEAVRDDQRRRRRGSPEDARRGLRVSR